MKTLAVALIRFYQLCISPIITPTSPCRFIPSCSCYSEQAIKKHGVCRGVWLTCKRLVKCGPWHEGGLDEVP